ncbi:MAG TPA: hypothetical protein VFZ11_13950 [Gemmatimonadaceae bacterium]
MTTRRLALLSIFAAALAVLAVQLAAFLPGGLPAWAAPALAAAIALALPALLALGAARNDRGLGRLLWPFLATFVILAGGFGAALFLPPESAADPLWFGLPRRAAIVLVGIGLLPMLVLPLAYAAAFDEHTLRPEDIARIRRLAEQAKERRAASADAEAHAER